MQSDLTDLASAGEGGAAAALAARWAAAARAIEHLAQVRSLNDLVAVLRTYARRVVGADGIAVVLRDGDLCHYVAEDAQEPLWAGQRFPAETCVSGWAMAHRQTVPIPDVLLDPRVPQDAYRATFVRSMLMVPIGRREPVAAIGAYWSVAGQPSHNEIALLEALARSASTALENGRLLSSLEQLNTELEDRVSARTAELERAQEILRQTQKMEVIGQLTGNVAHDFNNLLSPIMSSLDLVLAGRASGERLSRSATVAMEAAETAKMLVQRLLAFARRQPLSMSAVDLPALVEGMRSLLGSTIGASITLDVRIAPDLPAIRGDGHQLEMAILNLVVNARDAMPDGGALTISIDPAPGGGSPTPNYVRLAVRDTGCGMDMRTRALATEPFFTTKAPGHGTGLGLSMVEGLAGQLGGSLSIDSAPGEGTEVSVILPVATDGAVTAERDDPADMLIGGRGRVLLVDDEALVRMGTREMLEDLGYEVSDVDDAAEALVAIEEGPIPAIIVTDHIMPGMTGAELALRVRADHPEIAVMIVSGYQGIDLIAPDVVRLSKPFRQAHLDASIAAALAQVKAAA
ncbi:ATP-binding protein [Sphingomonas sp.]|uniref:ATP-binding protein n=1 Tax=Sphingomonas sp. TaxID=28214 RepID=UPI000DAF7ADE|nr:ATP-binding protein [Sphingomonas sp.]PZU09136.1 MAG: hybrid sensor histidine kinase/response regulator [Sphingomonas sp.]